MMKTSVFAALLAVLFASGLAGSAPRLTGAPGKARTRATPVKSQRKIIATYFHGNVRCISCRKIEAWTAESIRQNFAKDIQAGRLEWRLVNTDQRGNEHFTKDYKLFTQSVILSETKGGKQTRWKNMERLWTLLGDETAFKGYVRDEVATFVKGT